MEKNDLRSSVIEKGKIVTQIIIFSKGNKKTFRGVISDSISQSEFTRFDLTDGRRIYVNTENVDCFEIIPEGCQIPQINNEGGN
jgi:hypothetical protein